MKLLISALWMVLVTTAQTQAQDNAWLQIDAQPTEAEAEESARESARRHRLEAPGAHGVGGKRVS